MKRKLLYFITTFLVLASFTPTTPARAAVGAACCPATKSMCLSGDIVCEGIRATYNFPDDVLCPQGQNLNSGNKVCLYRSNWSPFSCTKNDPVCATFIHACDQNPAVSTWSCSGTEVCDGSTMKCVPKQEPINPQTPRVGSECPAGDISTGIGCIHTEPSLLIAQVLQIGIGTGSGIAFLLILAGTYKVLTSQGNPEGINHGKEQITSAIIGLVFIVLSVTVLQVIGFDILGLGPGGLGTR